MRINTSGICLSAPGPDGWDKCVGEVGGVISSLSAAATNFALSSLSSTLWFDAWKKLNSITYLENKIVFLFNDQTFFTWTFNYYIIL